jgi:hypothetical protein
MSNIATNIDRVTQPGTAKARVETKKAKYFAEKILRLLSVDAEGFCESKDWPYLWPIQKKDSK